jgi:hypothetical protein
VSQFQDVFALSREKERGSSEWRSGQMQRMKSDELCHLHCRNVSRQDNLDESSGSQVSQRTHCIF